MGDLTWDISYVKNLVTIKEITKTITETNNNNKLNDL